MNSNEQSKTPRTDAARGFHDMDTAVDAEEMEKLEIELAESRAISSRLCDERDRALRDRFEWENKLTAATQEAERITGELQRRISELNSIRVRVVEERDSARQERDSYRNAQKICQDCDAPTAAEYEQVCTSNHSLEKELVVLRHEVERQKSLREDEVAWWNRERDQSAQIKALEAQLTEAQSQLSRQEEHCVHWLNKCGLVENQLTASQAREKVLGPVLAKLAKIAHIHDLYEGPPCNNERHPDDVHIAYSEHGDAFTIITLGECRIVQAALARTEPLPAQVHEDVDAARAKETTP